MDVLGHHVLPASLLTMGGGVQAHQLVGLPDLLQAQGLLLLEHAVGVHGGRLQGTGGTVGGRSKAHYKHFPRPWAGGWGRCRSRARRVTEASGPAGTLTSTLSQTPRGSSLPTQCAAFGESHPVPGPQFPSLIKTAANTYIVLYDLHALFCHILYVYTYISRGLQGR